MKSVLLLVGILLSISASSYAFADVFNRQLIPIGESESFMANTGTGDAKDTGAVYYNPAGLTQIKDAQVSLSGSVYQVTSIHIDSVVSINGQPQPTPLDSSQFNSIPSTYAVAYPMGAYHFAFSVLVPDYSQANIAINTTNPQSALGDLSNSSSSDLWVGPSLARQLSDHWSIGVTLYAVKHSESSTDGLTYYSSSESGSTAIQEQINSYGLTGILGVLYKPDDGWSFGFRAQSPLAQLSGNASYFSSGIDVQGGAVSPSQTSLTGLHALYRLPADFTLGSAYEGFRNFHLLFDVSFQLAVHYQAISEINSTNYNTDPTFRYNFGAEYQLNPKLGLRAGFMYNPSAIHNLSSQDSGAIKVDFFGVTTGACWSVGHIRTGLGLFGEWGSGEYYNNGIISNASSQNLGALLTTAYIF